MTDKRLSGFVVKVEKKVTPFERKFPVGFHPGSAQVSGHRLKGKTFDWQLTLQTKPKVRPLLSTR
jgi:hypothetical protein